MKYLTSFLFTAMMSTSVSAASVDFDPAADYPDLVWIEGEGFRPADGIDQYAGGKIGKGVLFTEEDIPDCPWDTTAEAVWPDEQNKRVDYSKIYVINHNYYITEESTFWNDTPIFVTHTPICTVCRDDEDDTPTTPIVDEEISPVPLPAGAILILTALGSLFAIRRFY